LIDRFIDQVDGSYAMASLVRCGNIEFASRRSKFIQGRLHVGLARGRATSRISDEEHENE